MPRIALWVIDHRDSDHQPDGEIIKLWRLDPEEPPGERYADFCALYTFWAFCYALGEWPEIVGFFGYRKYLALDRVVLYAPAHAPNWWQTNKEEFDRYRHWLAKWDGAWIKRLLAEYDILQAAPFPLNGDTVWSDFAKSRSYEDAAVCASFVPYPTSERIFPYIFITRWSVFDRMMRELDPIWKKLDMLITAPGSVNEDYKKRPMAYVMERTYSLWLENSNLSIKEMPLLHCWETSQ